MKRYICIRECFHGYLYSEGDEKWFEDDEEVPEHFELADKEDHAKNKAPIPPVAPKTLEKPKSGSKAKAAKVKKESKQEEKIAADKKQTSLPADLTQLETPKTAEVLSE